MHDSPVLDKFVIQLVTKHGSENLIKVRDDLALLVGDVANKLSVETIKQRYESATRVKETTPRMILPSSYIDDETDDDSDIEIRVFQPPPLISKSILVNRDQDNENGIQDIHADPYARGRNMRERIGDFSLDPESESDDESDVIAEKCHEPVWVHWSPSKSKSIQILDTFLEIPESPPSSAFDQKLSQLTDQERRKCIEMTEKCREKVTVQFPNENV